MILTLPEIILLSILAFCLLVQLYFVLFVHLKLANAAVEEIPFIARKPLSVIVCARNEIKNLSEYLPTLMTQNYPEYEVVVVNDRSWDGTEEFLEQMEKIYSNLKVVKILDNDKFLAGKKFAVTMGIKAAKYEWLVFTDADCTPGSDQWLMNMQQPEDENIEIVLGYSPYLKKRGLLNALIRFETFFTAVNYLSFALKGMPYMGVGRNMAYKKTLFFKNKGFAAHMHIPSGDDDLFVNANANRFNTAIRFHQDSHVWSQPNRTWSGYLKQKKRHFGAGKMYQAKHKFILSLQIIFQFLFYGFFVASMFLGRESPYIAGGILLLSIIIRSLIYPKLLKRLNYGDLRWWFPILDILLFLFLILNGFFAMFGPKKVNWK
ncbi:cellulose synthase/poly-beta-1,6-N-acetylglucosamine synthase-like glycosyltransferase [Pedobacter psychrotolerans]|uniref:Cellulose synthase/poly-beta-1,6-N-acetylglucosamine synthase-like glycosyltransferase n=1 Tax=Pedobacter psychrotolerans TaxID=1843235 RepID=A0A4R2H8G4_9SPHI|nr:glycosyltransferase [Pedobacter psychrotolerans]TCO20745.1 cellulose synthase/poly-beta-1,6-N-acetylglucosamine synthase-like glycosyltransferase [Pedobacter psychrotolerans]GGE67769.1 glycosyl transferase family 2 [Pedobacter psychrotolerans]